MSRNVLDTVNLFLSNRAVLLYNLEAVALTNVLRASAEKESLDGSIKAI